MECKPSVIGACADALPSLSKYSHAQVTWQGVFIYTTDLAAGVLTALFMLVRFFVTMRTFIAGLTAGAVKR